MSDIHVLESGFRSNKRALGKKNNNIFHISRRSGSQARMYLYQCRDVASVRGILCSEQVRKQTSVFKFLYGIKDEIEIKSHRNMRLNFKSLPNIKLKARICLLRKTCTMPKLMLRCPSRRSQDYFKLAGLREMVPGTPNVTEIMYLRPADDVPASVVNAWERINKSSSMTSKLKACISFLKKWGNITSTAVEKVDATTIRYLIMDNCRIPPNTHVQIEGLQFLNHQLVVLDYDKSATAYKIGIYDKADLLTGTITVSRSRLRQLSLTVV